MEKILYTPNKDTKVIVNRNQQTRSVDPRIESRIDSIWQRKVRQAQRTSRALWDGETYRLSSWEMQEPDTLVLNLGTTTYKETLGTHEAYPNFIDQVLGPDYFANTVVVTGSLITSDNIFVIGERSEGVIESGKFGTFGGSLDRKQDDDISSIGDIGHAFQDEIVEEIGVQPEDISSVLFLGLTQDSKHYPQIHFIGMVPHPFSWVISRFNEGRDEEHRKLVGIPTEKISKESTQYMENGSGALRAHLLLLLSRGEDIQNTLQSIPVLQANHQP